MTEKAQRAGRANASSGRIMVTIPNDHFGPIGPEHDPDRKLGVLVGSWACLTYGLGCLLQQGGAVGREASLRLLRKNITSEIKRMERNGDLRPSQVRRLDLLKKGLDLV